MTVPPKNDPIWQQIIVGKVNFDFEYLAANLLQRTLTSTFSQDPSPANLSKCCDTLRELFVRNADQPLVHRDLEKISTKEINGGT